MNHTWIRHHHYAWSGGKQEAFAPCPYKKNLLANTRRGSLSVMMLDPADIGYFRRGELLKAIDGSYTPNSSDEARANVERIIRERGRK